MGRNLIRVLVLGDTQIIPPFLSAFALVIFNYACTHPTSPLGRVGQADPTEFTSNIPQYAVLSHTWSTHAEDELLFEDLAKEDSKSKPGYRKISSVASRPSLTLCNTFGSTHAALTSGISANFRTQSILCFGDTEMPLDAT